MPHNDKGIFMKLRSYILSLLIGLLFVQPVFCEDTTNSVVALQQQIQKLKAENETLKQENQVLRKLVFEKQSPAQTVAEPQAVTQPQATTKSAARVPPASYRQPAASSTAQQGYWLTTSSNKRHNSSCRYYGTTKGRSCGPNDGIACKICGG
jgi:hypothetical protein